MTEELNCPTCGVPLSQCDWPHVILDDSGWLNNCRTVELAAGVTRERAAKHFKVGYQDPTGKELITMRFVTHRRRRSDGEPIALEHPIAELTYKTYKYD